MTFFKDVISHLIKNAFEAHTKFSVADNTAVGDNPIRSISLDAIPVNDEVIISLAWDGGEKLFEKKLSDSEAAHQFDLISTDLAEVAALTKQGEYDSAKGLMGKLSQKYTENTGDIVPTNMPKLNTTQASDEFKGLWKQAKVSLRNIFPSGTVQQFDFETTEELKEYQGQGSAQDHIPLWDKVKQESPEAKKELVPPSMSYEDLEKNKEVETKNLDKRIHEQVKTELESALEEKKATMFTDNDQKLIDGMRAVGRNWDEIKKYMVKELAYDKESVDLYIDDLRSKEDGTELPVEESSPLTPPTDLVSPETHEKLLQDIEEKKSKPPVEEVKQEEIEKAEPPIKEESSIKCPKCREDIWDYAKGHKLNKCWNCGLAFDSPEKESAKSTLCPQCDGEGSIPSVRGGRVIAIDCPSCGGDTHVKQMDKEVESAQDEIARADNSDIRKVATVIPLSVKREIKEEIAPSIYRMNAPGATMYRFSLEGNKIYRGEYAWDEDFGPYQFVYNMQTGEYKENPAYKPTAFASLKTAADDLNPLQEPIVEKPTLPTQDVIPMEKSLDHNAPQKGDRVFVSSDLTAEKAGFEATFISNYQSKGTNFSIVETDDGDLLDVESHRVVKTSEGANAQVAEPVMEPRIEAPIEEPIPVTPSSEKLVSSQDPLLEIKAEAEALLKEVDGMGKVSYFFVKKGLEKYAGDSAYEANGWTRVWVDDLEIEVSPKYPEILKLADESVRIQALKGLAREIAQDTLSTKTNAGGDIAQMWFDSLKPSDHDRIDWVALATPQTTESSLITAAKSTKCIKCDIESPISDMIENVHGAGYLCKTDAPKWNQDKAASDFEKGISQNKTATKVEFVEENNKSGFKDLTKFLNSKFKNQEQMEMQLESLCAEWAMSNGYVLTFPGGDVLRFVSKVISDPDKLNEELAKKPVQSSLNLKADPTPLDAPQPTGLKDVKITPKYIDKEKAVPATPEMDAVLSKMAELENNLAILDRAKKEIAAKMKEEMAKIDQSGERVQMEAELQEAIEKAGVLIEAVESKVVSWRDKLLTLQNEEVQLVPKITPNEMLEKIYKKFDGAEKFVQSVLNGLLSLAKNVNVRTLVRWPSKKSSLGKEASALDEMNLINEELLAALKELSSPL